MDTTVTIVSNTSAEVSGNDPTSTDAPGTTAPPTGMHDARRDELDEPGVRKLVDAATRRHARLTGLGIGAAFISFGALSIIADAARDKDLGGSWLILAVLTAISIVVGIFALRGWLGNPPRYAFIGTLDERDRREAHADIAAATPSSRPDLRFAEGQYATWAAQTGPRAPFIVAAFLVVLAVYAWAYSGWRLLTLVPLVAYLAWTVGRAIRAWRQRKAAAAYLAAS